MNQEQFFPQLWARVLGVASSWFADFQDDKLFVRVESSNTPESASALEVSAIVHRGWFWSRIQLDGIEAYELRGISHQNASRFVAALARSKELALRRLEHELQIDRQTLVPVHTHLNEQLFGDRYLCARDRQDILERIAQVRERVDASRSRVCSPHAQRFSFIRETAQAIETLQKFIVGGERELRDRNQRYVQDEVLRWRTFFDHCEDRPLTDEQARSIVTFEENTLLVAAAGSGKTSTVVGKVAYALAKGIAGPKDILCLAFNSKAAAEIGERIEGRLTAMLSGQSSIDADIRHRLVAVLKEQQKIHSRTFHSLGLNIIRQCEPDPKRLRIRDDSKERLRRAIALCQHDPHFNIRYLFLQTVSRFPRPIDSKFRSPHEYNEYLRSMWRARKSGQKLKDQDTGIRTLGSDKLVQSFEEVAISNWLYLMGVEFEYEATFEQGSSLLGASWKPDFTYKVRGADGEIFVVHEHFGLDANGQAPHWFKDPQLYAEQALHKQKILQLLDAQHFWTTSAEYLSGRLFEKLQNRLESLGVSMNPRDPQGVLNRLQEVGLKPDDELIGRAVSQIRQNGWEYEELESRLLGQPEPARARLFLNVAWPVAQAVKTLLIKDGQLDYDEMMQRALEYLRKDPALLPFKLIVADEFQDTAPGRGEMVRQILHSRQDSLFFAVGDDWQAINRFAGSDLRFFSAFGNAFNRRINADARCDLTRTFRSNQGISDVARAFVLKNKSQIHKEVNADDKTSCGVIDVRTYQSDKDVLPLVEQTLQRWVDRHPIGNKPSVFILGRYGENHAGGLSKQDIRSLNERWADRVTLRSSDEDKPPTLYMTIHSSKGLQADYVMVVGMFHAGHDWFCFPSEREDDPLLQLVLPEKEALTDADERRLFYVALTRAKHQVALLMQQQFPSAYALELLRDHRSGAVLFNGSDQLPGICPACKRGLALLRFNPKSNQSFYACSDRWGCGKMWSSWPPNPADTNRHSPNVKPIDPRRTHSLAGSAPKKAA